MVRLAEDNICAAQRLLQIIENPSSQDIPARSASPGEFVITTGGFLIGPQDAESNAALALEALRLAGDAQKLAGDAMARVSTSPTAGPACSRADFALAAGSGAFADLTLGSELAHFYVEGLQVSEDAAAHLGRAGSAVSDAELSRATDRAEAALMRNAPFASRAAAAHGLIGGAHGLLALSGDRIEGLFDRAPLSGDGQQALTLLRTIAPDPALLADTSIPLEELLVGGPSVPEGAPAFASIRYRLTRFFGEPELATATAAELYERLGFDAAALGEARAWIANENAAFDRPVRASGPRRARTLPVERLPDGTQSDFPLFTATRLPPRAAPPAYWSSLVRFDPTPAVRFTSLSDVFSAPWPFGPTGQGALPPGATWGEEAHSGGLVNVTRRSGRTYASIREDAVLRARELLGRLRPRAGDSVEVREALIGMRETIAGPLPDGLGGGEDDSFRGRVRFCGYHYPTASPSTGFLMNIDLGVEGGSQSAGLALVLGAEGLSCATEGTIDGIACSAAELAGLRATTILPMTPFGGGRFIVAMEAAPGTGPRPELSSYFIVRRDPSATGAPMPGEFEPLIGFIGELDAEQPANSIACTGAPITPDLDSEVAALMGMSPDDPARSAVNCVGLPESINIPLENELLRDSFPEESSWRHFLDSAVAASTTADGLGDDLVRLGIEMDLRAERQADELERICGVRLNPTVFARELPPRVTVATGGRCASPYRYVAASAECVLDPIAWASEVGALADEDVARLEECVGTDATVWSALGDQPVCLWQVGEDTTTLCQGSTSENPCPVVARGASTVSDCVRHLPEGSTATPILVPDTNALRFFTIPPLDDWGTSGGTSGGPQEYPCEALARIRGHVARAGDLEEVLGSGLMNPLELTATTAQLGWVPSAGDYSRVTFGGSTIASTGSVAGSGGLWPNGQTLGGLNVFTHLCPGLALATDPVDNDSSLFCLANVARGSGRPELRRPRARTNDLLARAVLAARLMTGLSLEGRMFLPYRPRVEGDPTPPSARSMETRVVATDFIEARTGSVWVDQVGDSDGAREFYFDRLDAYAEFVEGGVIDWQRCPYELAVCPSDPANVVDFDDVSSSGLPLIVHRLGNTRRADASRALRDFFGTGDGTNHLGAYLRYAAEGGDLSDLDAAHDGTLRRITTYFDRAFQVGFDVGHGCAEAAGCRCSERPAACIDEYLDEERVDILATAPGNQLHIAAPGGGLRPADFLNGLELSCMAARIQSEDPEFGCDEPLEIRSIGDLLQMDAYLQCVADNIESRAAATVISDLPASLVQALRGAGPTAVGTRSGELASDVSSLSGAFSQLSLARVGIADALRRMAALIVQLRSAIAQSDIAGEIERLSLASTVWNQVTGCVVAVASIPTNDAATSAGRAAGAAATCLNSIAQITLASAISVLRGDLLTEQLRSQFADFDVAANQEASSMKQSAASIRTQVAAIDAALARINTGRTAARRALNRALYLESDGADEHSAASSAYRARRNTLLARYAEAHDRARRAAFIARLAIEQRLAMPLDTITDDLATVEAPSEWVDELCTMPSIDYDGLSGVAGADGEAPLGPEGYAGSYVGDYVERLRQVVESYSFLFPFREGTDTAVISLRDDVFHTLASCEVETPNLLYQAERLDVLATESRAGWERYGCDPAAIPTPPTAVVDAHCVSARPLTPDESPMFFEPAGGGSDLGRPIGFRVRFGGSPAATAETSLIQRVILERGRYRLSWYGGPGTVENVYARGADGTRLSGVTPWRSPLGTMGWARYHTFIDVSETQEVSVVIHPNWGAVPPEDGVELDFGGLMVEDVSTTVLGNLRRMVPDPSAPATEIALGELSGPGPFFATGSTRTRVIQSCIDISGDQFRSDAWSHDCTRVCPDGYDAECPDRVATLRCYYQTSFSIDSDFIGQTLTGTPAGFADGNYNYRIDSLAVNLVGTGLRVCDGAPGCFGAGNLSYSFLHGAPYTVRNARGELYDAPLFPGRLESARALAAERYLTNPLSSADTSLIGPYQRPDLAGRPLGGTLVLRIWDEPTLNFDRLEDVQVVLGYRYWQRQR